MAEVGRLGFLVGKAMIDRQLFGGKLSVKLRGGVCRIQFLWLYGSKACVILGPHISDRGALISHTGGHDELPT